MVCADRSFCCHVTREEAQEVTVTADEDLLDWHAAEVTPQTVHAVFSGLEETIWKAFWLLWNDYGHFNDPCIGSDSLGLTVQKRWGFIFEKPHLFVAKKKVWWPLWLFASRCEAGPSFLFSFWISVWGQKRRALHVFNSLQCADVLL